MSAPPADPAATWFPITALKPWERNPRKNAEAVAKVAESIRRFGFGSPILARQEDCQIIAGRGGYQRIVALRWFLGANPIDEVKLAGHGR